jgi:hypothetical protein
MVLYDWLNERVGIPWSTDFRAIGRVVDGKLVGVVAYNNFTGSSCQMHMAGAGPHWINRRFLRLAFALPFETWGLKVVLGVVPSGNADALVVDKKLGFIELVTIPGAHPDGALHILEMRRENCRLLAGATRDGQEVGSTGTA